jgi:type III secretory pathway component EscV
VLDRATVLAALRELPGEHPLEAAERVIDRLAPAAPTLRVSRAYLASLAASPGCLRPEDGRAMRREALQRLGFPVPPIGVQLDDSLQDQQFAFDLNDLRGRTRVGFEPDRALVPHNPAEVRVERLGIVRTGYTGLCDFVPESAFRNMHAWYCTAGTYIFLGLYYDLRRFGWRLLTATRLEELFSDARISNPTTMELVNRVDTLHLCRSLRRLIRARLSNKFLLALVGALSTCEGNLDSPPTDPDPVVEYLRQQWPFVLPSILWHGGTEAAPYELHTEAEAALDAAPEDPAVHDRIVEDLARAVQPSPTADGCLVTTRRLRDLVADLVRERLPLISVVSYDEVLLNAPFVPLPEPMNSFLGSD